MIHLLIFSLSCLNASSFYLTQDEAWWKVDFTPTPSRADDEAEASEVEEEEGELDSVGRLFLNLTENEAHSGFTNNLPLSPYSDLVEPANENLPAPDVIEVPAPSTTTAPSHKRTRAAVQKVPNSRISHYMMNTSQPQALRQEKDAAKDAESSKRRKTRSNASEDSLNTGIPSCSVSRWTKSIQKTPSISHPKAGNYRISESQSLSASSGDSVNLPDDFPINVGYVHFSFDFS